jgi:hypothetical protein
LSGDHAFETALARHIEQDLREGRVVFNDQQDAVARHDIIVVIGDFDDLALIVRRERQFRRVEAALAGRYRFNAGHRLSGAFWDRRLVDARQIERELAAFARRADDANFAAQQSR